MQIGTKTQRGERSIYRGGTFVWKEEKLRRRAGEESTIGDLVSKGEGKVHGVHAFLLLTEGPA